MGSVVNQIKYTLAKGMCIHGISCEPCHAKRAIRVFLIKMCIFLFLNVLKLVCENFSRIYVKINFLWGLLYSLYAAASFSESMTS